MRKVVQERQSLAMAPEQKEFLGLLETGSAMCGSSINGTCRKLEFNLPIQAPRF